MNNNYIFCIYEFIEFVIQQKNKNKIKLYLTNFNFKGKIINSFEIQFKIV